VKLAGKVRQAQEILLLTWHPTRVDLCAVIEEPEVRIETRASLQLAVSSDQRYDLLLRMTSSTHGWLRVPAGQRSLFIRVEEKGAFLTSTPPLPVESALDLHRGRIHACDLVTVIDRTYLYFLGTNMLWNRRPLPSDITTYDVSFDSSGGLWAVGKAPSLRIPNANSEVAIRYQSPSLTAFEPIFPRLSILALAKTILNGGMEQLHTIDAEDNPVCAISDCSWLLDDPSSFLFVSSISQQWSVKHLAGQFVRRLLRSTSGTLLIFTAGGTIFKVTNTGVVHLVSNAEVLRAVVFNACPFAPAAAKLLVRGADIKDGKIVVVAGLYQANKPRLSWIITTACQSINTGISWSILAKTFPSNGDNELIDIAILQ
jgi:hypothetical protein